MKRGSIELARSICYEVAGATDESDDMTGSGYGSVDIAEILSAEVDRLRAEVEALRAQVTAERERCARICERWRATWEREGIPHPDFIATVIAADIRKELE